MFVSVRWPLLALSALSCAALRADPLDDYVRSQMEKDHIPGVCLAIIKKDGTKVVRSYGFANLETQAPFTPQSVFRIASLSKQFCAYVTFQAIEDGRMKLDDPVTKFALGVPTTWEKVTIKDILGHRSGIGDPPSFQYTANYTPDQYLKLLGDTPLSEEPGSKFRYNNHAYSALGIIVGKGQPGGLPGLVKRLVFDPAGMKDSRYYDADELIPNRADAYRWRDGKYINPLPLRPEIFHGSGGILTSMDDMIRYDQALRSGGALNQDILQKQWTPIFGGKEGYGGGWFVQEENGEKTVVHTGGTWGFTSIFIRNLTTGESFIMFRNSEGGELQNWADEILKRARVL